MAAEEEASPTAEEEVKGYTKKIKKKAPKGAKKPKKGVTVRVNYTGRLDNADGKQFDSSFSKKKNEHRPLEFKVGNGRVIQGWDEALLTMGSGEKAELTIQASHAYGKKGLPEAGIPPNQVNQCAHGMPNVYN